VTNAGEFRDWLGQRLPTRPQMALCRCGGSEIKPFCDGTHARIGFSGAKDPGRVPDQRDSYTGQQVTIFDNRGTCQHSGLCTDRLATVFRAGAEPFVAPSGGRMDEIIRAVRDCPSGALSYAVDEQEARADVDYHGQRDPAIEVSRDGPYRVTGGIALSSPGGTGGNDGPDGTNGDEPARNAGASREHYACAAAGTRRTSLSAAVCTGT
jgi:CDGSH-type Zn-finger protein/ferredoxin